VKLAAVVAVAALFLATSAAATTSSGFSFGREGGNIIPFHARISATGRVFVNQEPRGRLSRKAMTALHRLVDQVRFTTLPARTVCAGALPDFATLSVTATAHGRTRSVSVRGGCSPRFQRLYNALAHAAGLG
jgi:hypothetical protein